MRTSRWIAALAAVVLSAASALASELTLDVPRAWVRPGEAIRARAAWSLGEGVYFEGAMVADWKLTDASGKVVGTGRRPVRVRSRASEDPPYRFSVRARVPRGTVRGGLVLSVLVHYGTGNALGEWGAEASASVPLLVAPRGVDRTRFEQTLEGRLVRGRTVGALAALDTGSGWGPAELFGTVASQIVANPAFDGASARVTVRALWERDLLYIPEDFPPQEVVAFEWLDPPATPVGAVVVGGIYDQKARLKSRIPPADLVADPLSWRALLDASRAPSVLRTQEEFDAFATALRPALDDAYDPTAAFASTDFGAYDVVALFTGTTPGDGYRVAPLSTDRDERTQTTWVRYAVAGPSQRDAPGGPLADACCLFLIPKLTGEVRVERQEWIPRPPRWW